MWVSSVTLSWPIAQQAATKEPVGAIKHRPLGGFLLSPRLREEVRLRLREEVRLPRLSLNLAAHQQRQRHMPAMRVDLCGRRILERTQPRNLLPSWRECRPWLPPSQDR